MKALVVSVSATVAETIIERLVAAQLPYAELPAPIGEAAIVAPLCIAAHRIMCSAAHPHHPRRASIDDAVAPAVAAYVAAPVATIPAPAPVPVRRRPVARRRAVPARLRMRLPAAVPEWTP